MSIIKDKESRSTHEEKACNHFLVTRFFQTIFKKITVEHVQSLSFEDIIAQISPEKL